MGKNFTKAEKLERVEQVLIEVIIIILIYYFFIIFLLFQMNLKHVQDTYIGQGDRLRGISGGEVNKKKIKFEFLLFFLYHFNFEKRRLAFASEVNKFNFII
jgi:hypothetical protein